MKLKNANKIILDESDAVILGEILERYRDKCTFFAFGSRVNGKAKKYSDLDIAIICDNEVDLMPLKMALEDSNLTITIDLIDLNKIDRSFKAMVLKEKVEI